MVMMRGVGSSGCNDVMEVKLNFLKSHYYVELPPVRLRESFSVSKSLQESDILSLI